MEVLWNKPFTYLLSYLLKVTSFTFPLLQVSRQSRDVVTVGLLKRKRQKASSNSSKFSKSYLLTFLDSFSKTLVERHNVVTLGKYPKRKFFKHTLFRATSEWTWRHPRLLAPDNNITSTRYLTTFQYISNSSLILTIHFKNRNNDTESINTNLN